MLNRILIIMLLTVLLIVSFLSGYAAEQDLISVTGLEGRVEKEVRTSFLNVIKIKTWRQVKVGENLQPGDRIRTNRESSLELAINNEIFIRVEPGSELVIGDIIFQAADAGYSIKLDQGRIWARVEKVWQELFKFKVITPSAVAGVRGTLFSLLVEEGVTLLSVQEGLVELITIDQADRVMVGAGEMSSAQLGRVIQPVMIDDKEQKVWQQPEVERWIEAINGQVVQPDVDKEVKGMKQGKAVESDQGTKGESGKDGDNQQKQDTDPSINIENKDDKFET